MKVDPGLRLVVNNDFSPETRKETDAMMHMKLTKGRG